MKFFRNKTFIVVLLITLVVLITMGVFASRGSDKNIVGNGVGIVFSPFQSFFGSLADGVASFVTFTVEMKGYKEQNEKLLIQINELQKKSRSVEEYAVENERLKKLLDLKQNNEQYDLVVAQIIARENGNWFDSFVINRGSTSGLAIKDVVINNYGLIGQIVDIGATWAKVSTIINPNNSVGVSTLRTQSTAVVEGDLLLAKKQLCKMNFLSQDADIVAGDMIQTSGLGGVFPSGILVGKVREVTVNNTDKTTYAIIDTAVNFKDLKEAMVIRGGQVGKK